MVMLTPSWGWIIFASALLGLNQGFCWSTTVIMKIDLVGPERRGLAMGFKEAAGYVAVSLAAFASGYLASHYALRPQPFYLGVVFALGGLFLSLFFVQESHGHGRHESRLLARSGSTPGQGESPQTPSFAHILLLTSWRERSLFSASQAGMINNLNDGMTWGLFLLVFAATGLGIERIGLLAAVSDVAHPDWRASSIGVYRLWRDGGYVLGALIAGILSDLLGVNWAIGTVGALTLASGVVVAARMYETLPAKQALSSTSVDPAVSTTQLPATD